MGKAREVTLMDSDGAKVSFASQTLAAEYMYKEGLTTSVATSSISDMMTGKKRSFHGYTVYNLSEDTPTKRCTKCGLEKSLEEFCKKKKSKDGLSWHCSDCRREDNYKNKEGVRNSILYKKYGISSEEYDLILLEQDYRCAICGKEIATNGRRLSVDHSHETGNVRGLLCDDCNKGIGMLGDSVYMLRKAVKYLLEYGDTSMTKYDFEYDEDVYNSSDDF